MFSADTNEPSRIELYRRLAAKIGGAEKVQEASFEYPGTDGKNHYIVGFKVDIPDSARVRPPKTLNQSDLPSLYDIAAHGRGADPRATAVADAARTGADLPAEEYRGFRGSYTRAEDSSQVVRLFKRAVASMLPHELGHVYGNDVATVLASARDTRAGLLIADPVASSPGGGPGTHDTLLLKGITKQQLAANQGEIAFHA